jgi:single-stranded DNA-binding protein
MIDAILSGRIYGAPAEKTSGKTGKPFVTCKVRTAAGDGESLFVNVIAFDSSVCAGLLALGDGDSVSLSGALTPKVWTDRDGHARPALDLVAHGLLTSYHVTRKRKAMQPEQEGQQQRQPYRRGDYAADPGELDDGGDLPT